MNARQQRSREPRDRRAHGLKILLVLAAGLFLCTFLWYRYRMSSLAYREKKFAPLVKAACAKHELPAALVMAVIWKESRFKPNQIGSKNEIGLMQLMDGAVQDWARLNGHSRLPERSELFTPALNIEIGTWYLSHAASHWRDYASWEILMLAEYNAGYSRVDKMWKPKEKDAKLCPGNISFPGTRDYIKQILRKRKEYDSEQPSQ